MKPISLLGLLRPRYFMGQGGYLNCNESGCQAGRSGGAQVLASRGVIGVHSITPDEKENLSGISCMNAAEEAIPNFYNFKGKQLAMQPKAWMTSFLFSKWVAHFISYVQEKGGKMSLENRHVLIMNDHNSHAAVEVVHQALSIGLDLITLPSHILHAF